MEGAAPATESQLQAQYYTSPARAVECQDLCSQPMLAVWGNGVSQEKFPHAKRQGAVSGRECMNSPTDLQSHSPCTFKSTNVGGKKLAGENSSSKVLNPDPWTRLIGRANEERIIVNGKTVTALLDTGSQVTHISLDYCQAMGIPIHHINQLVKIEGAGGCYRLCGLQRGRIIFSNGNPCVQD